MKLSSRQSMEMDARIDVIPYKQLPRCSSEEQYRGSSFQ